MPGQRWLLRVGADPVPEISLQDTAADPELGLLEALHFLPSLILLLSSPSVSPADACPRSCGEGQQPGTHWDPWIPVKSPTFLPVPTPAQKRVLYEDPASVILRE